MGGSVFYTLHPVLPFSFCLPCRCCLSFALCFVLVFSVFCALSPFFFVPGLFFPVLFFWLGCFVLCRFSASCFCACFSACPFAAVRCLFPAFAPLAGFSVRLFCFL